MGIKGGDNSAATPTRGSARDEGTEAKVEVRFRVDAPTKDGETRERGDNFEGSTMKGVK